MLTYKRFNRNDAIKCTKDEVLVIPEGYTVLDCDFAFFVVREDLPRVKTLWIPASVTYIETMRGDPSCGPYGYKNNPFSEYQYNCNNKKCYIHSTYL